MQYVWPLSKNDNLIHSQWISAKNMIHKYDKIHKNKYKIEFE